MAATESGTINRPNANPHGEQAMRRFRDYFAERDDAPQRRTRTSRTSASASASERVSAMTSLDAASLTLPADSDAKLRAALFAEFWDALDAFRHRDILVVAMCPDHDD